MKKILIIKQSGLSLSLIINGKNYNFSTPVITDVSSLTELDIQMALKKTGIENYSIIYK